MNYWKVIEFANWPENHAAGEEMKDLFKKGALLKMHDFYHEKEKELQNRLEDHSEDITGNRHAYFGLNDSYSDLLSHIVGLGEKFFSSVLKNPEIARRMLVERNFEECFAYIFQDMDIYDDGEGDELDS